MSNPVYKRAVALMEAPLGDELVALDPAGGECFGFNTVATSVWRALDSPKTLAELQDALVDEYDVAPEECARELKGLLDELTAKGLVTLST